MFKNYKSKLFWDHVVIFTGLLGWTKVKTTNLRKNETQINKILVRRVDVYTYPMQL